jgi:hypothetical protein
MPGDRKPVDDEQFVAALIEFGNGLETFGLPLEPVDADLSDLHGVERRARSLSLQQLEAVIRAVVILERPYNRGSVAPSIRLFRELWKRDYDRANALSRWIITRAPNEWTPFGRTRGEAKSLSDFERIEELTAIARGRWEAEEQARIEEQRALRHEAVEAHQLVQKAKARDRSEAISALYPKTAPDRLRTIADHPMPVDYWPTEFASVDPVELDEVTARKLAGKARRAKHKEWRALSRVLTARLGGPGLA